MNNNFFGILHINIKQKLVLYYQNEKMGAFRGRTRALFNMSTPIFDDFDELKIAIQNAVSSIDQLVIDRSLLEYRNRLKQVVENGGAHIE